ncbi:hypothetical protein M0R45_030788 [Rubus argutus]|uniref:Uncharacterized protein n=1 Tax=Rubus argutus TaxID=59490 RepID=A0AAW1WFN1_RUBAR
MASRQGLQSVGGLKRGWPRWFKAAGLIDAGSSSGQGSKATAAGFHGWADAGDARRQRWGKREIDGGSAWLGTRRSRRQRQWRSGSSGDVRKSIRERQN